MRRPGILARLFKRNGGIEAGGAGWRWNDSPSIFAPQQSALAARGPAKARATALAVNSPIGARAVEAWTASLVGRGYQVQSAHPDRATAATLNEAFEELTGCLLPLIVRGIVRDGEALIRIVAGPDGFRLLPLPADQIDPHLSRDLGDGARIVAGIEHDANDQVTAYHVLPAPPGDPFATFSTAIRIPAAEVIHAFDHQWPGQVRGLSWFAPVLLKTADYDAASDAMLKNLQVSALFAGFVTDLNGGTGGFDGAPEAGALNVSLEPGTVRLLPPGADVKFSQPGSGLSQQVDFIRLQLHEIAAGLGLQYSQLTGDLSQVNYSSARFGHLEHRRRVEMLQRTLIEAQILRPIWRAWIAWKGLAGEITTAEAASPDFLNVRFVRPGFESLDPLKEVNADIRALEAGLKSRAEITAGRGRDLAELDEEIAADRPPKRKDAA